MLTKQLYGWRRLKICQVLLPVLLLSLVAVACTRPASIQVRKGSDPINKDDDVTFRTNYYFRVFDYCASIRPEGPVLPQNDSLFRFEMTGKAAFGRCPGSKRTGWSSTTSTLD